MARKCEWFLIRILQQARAETFSCIVKKNSQTIWASLNEQLSTKLIAENWLATEDIANEKYESLLDAIEKAKAQVGTTNTQIVGGFTF